MSRISGKGGTLVLSDSTGRKLEVQLADWEVAYSGHLPTFSVTVIDPLGGGALVLELPNGAEG